MNFISVRDFREKSALIWKRLKNKEDLVITSNGKPVAIISSASGEYLEEELLAIRRARAEIGLRSMQLKSLANGKDRLSDKEIESEIAAARKAYR